MDPREKRFLAGEPPELIPQTQRRRDKWKTSDREFLSDHPIEDDDDSDE